MNKIGRPITSDVKNNKDYFNDYYKNNNNSIICDCGLNILKFSLGKHRQSKIHKKLIEVQQTKNK